MVFFIVSVRSFVISLFSYFRYLFSYVCMSWAVSFLSCLVSVFFLHLCLYVFLPFFSYLVLSLCIDFVISLFR